MFEPGGAPIGIGAVFGSCWDHREAVTVALNIRA
jgi:hypothetical protein